MKVLALACLLIVTAVRLWVAASAPVTAEEAFQWMCASRLDWAYFDNPGGVAWLVRAGVDFLGPTALGIRLAFPLFAALATIAAFLAGRALFDESAGWFAAIALNAMPAFNLASVHASPPAPMLTGILAAAWCIPFAIERRSSAHWVGAGLVGGLAMQFSELALLLVPAMFLACAVAAHRGRHFRAPGPYVASLLIAAAASPWFVWNQVHGWPARALGTLKTTLTLHLADTPAEVSSFLGDVSIGVVLVLGGTALVAARSATLHIRPRILLAAALPFALAWTYAVLHGSMETTIALALSAMLLPAIGLILARGPIRLAVSTLLVLGVLSSAWILVQPSRQADPWNATAREIGTLIEESRNASATPLFVIAQDPEMTAQLGYHMSRPGAPEVFLRESQDLSNQFGLWPRYDDFSTVGPIKNIVVQEGIVDEGTTTNPYMGRTAIYVTREESGDLPQTITAAFRDVTPIATISANGEQVLRIYRCEDYQTMPL